MNKAAILALIVWVIISKDTIGAEGGPKCFYVLENEKGDRRKFQASFSRKGYFIVGDNVYFTNEGKWTEDMERGL